MMKNTLLTLFVLIVVIGANAQTVTITLPTDSGKIFTSIEQVPEFPGGLNEFANFLKINIHYPVIARQHYTQGRVILAFIVEKDGALSNFEVVRSVSKEIDDEALRVMRISPKWRPGLQNGKPERVRYSVPISFKLSN